MSGIVYYNSASLDDLLNTFGTWKLQNKLAAGTQGVDLELNNNVDSFLQWITDNADTEPHPGNNTAHIQGYEGNSYSWCSHLSHSEKKPYKWQWDLYPNFQSFTIKKLRWSWDDLYFLMINDPN